MFLAIPLPAALQRGATEASAGLGLDPQAWRLVREESLHATIRFLGDVEEDRRAALDTAWRAAAEGAGRITLELSVWGAFPDARRPRILWVGLTERAPGDALARLAERVEQAARNAGFAGEERPFSPHVTLARARPGRRVRGIEGLESKAPLGGFVADRLVLFRSDLGPGGARYREDASYPLAP